MTSWNDIPLDVWSQHIFPFVGSHQYRFVGGVNKSFEEAYCKAFPEKTTKLYVSSLEHGKICFNEVPSSMVCTLQYFARKHTWYKTLYHDAVQSAAEKGHLELLQWDEGVCHGAAEKDHLELLQWALLNGCPWDKWVCYHAATNGHLELLQWARSNGCPWGRSVCSVAAKNGYLEFLQKLYNIIK